MSGPSAGPGPWETLMCGIWTERLGARDSVPMKLCLSLSGERRCRKDDTTDQVRSHTKEAERTLTPGS